MRAFIEVLERLNVSGLSDQEAAELIIELIYEYLSSLGYYDDSKQA